MHIGIFGSVRVPALTHLLCCLLAAFFSASPGHAQRLADHVFIVSLDGGKPAVIAASNMPVLQKLVAEGAVTWSAQTIYPPMTLPSHTSMLTGLGPRKHRVLWNDYLPARGIIAAPTVFTIAKRFDARIATALFAGKSKFLHLVQGGSLDFAGFTGPRDRPLPPGAQLIERELSQSQAVAKAAAAYIAVRKPNLSFIHLSDPDSAGHSSGWGSPEQKAAFEVSDQALGEIVRSLEQAGIAGRSVIIVSADHGGHGKDHGDNIPDDMTIPWIVWGKGVRKATTIREPVTTFDSAATALWLLGVPLPAEFDGKPVTQAFETAK